MPATIQNPQVDIALFTNGSIGGRCQAGSEPDTHSLSLVRVVKALETYEQGLPVTQFQSSPDP